MDVDAKQLESQSEITERDLKDDRKRKVLRQMGRALRVAFYLSVNRIATFVENKCFTMYIGE